MWNRTGGPCPHSRGSSLRRCPFGFSLRLQPSPNLKRPPRQPEHVHYAGTGERCLDVLFDPLPRPQPLAATHRRLLTKYVFIRPIGDVRPARWHRPINRNVLFGVITHRLLLSPSRKMFRQLLIDSTSFGPTCDTACQSSNACVMRASFLSRKSAIRIRPNATAPSRHHVTTSFTLRDSRPANQMDCHSSAKPLR